MRQGVNESHAHSLREASRAQDQADRHAAAVRDYVAPFLAGRASYLEAGRVHGTPLYLFRTDTVRQRIHRFRSAFTAHLPHFRVYYALKSNPHRAIVQTLVREGCGLDVSSGHELRLALDSGASEILFSGPGKTDQELDAAIAHPERVCVLIDSFGELERLARLTLGARKRIQAGVRLTTAPHGLWRKFGIPGDRLGAFWERAAAAPYVDLCGIQFHTSWNLSPKAQVAFIRDLGRQLVDLDPALCQSVRFLDIGGGYWPQPGEWLHAERVLDDAGNGSTNPPIGTEAQPWSRPPEMRPAEPIEVFARRLAEALGQAIFPRIRCAIWTEPGRWICNDAMHIVLRVTDRKSPDLVITDGGTNAVGWERYEHDYFPVINLTRPDTSEHPCLILGSLCTPHDVWGRTYCGADIEVGDLLLIPNQGAYTYSLRQEFIKSFPREAILPVGTL